MPAKFRLKEFVKGGVYHIYNKGIDGRGVFGDDDDYNRFLSIIKNYVSLPRVEFSERFKGNKPSVTKRKKQMNLEGEVDVLAYCLMPDHFHLLVKQNSSDGLTKFMRRVNTAYVMYYNRRQGRRGPLFENVYRGVLVKGEEKERWQKTLTLTLYLHLHPVTRVRRQFGPVVTVTSTRPEEHKFTSLGHYLGNIVNKWINTDFVNLNPNEYAKLIEQPQWKFESDLHELLFE